MLKHSRTIFFSTLIVLLLTSCVLTLDTNKLNERMFKKYDKNQDRTFDELEFLPILKNVYKFEKLSNRLVDKHINREEYLKSEFQLYDHNKDGHVTLAEIQMYDKKKNFRILDVDRDGYLDLNNEISVISNKVNYKSLIRNKGLFVMDGSRVISYKEYLAKIKNLFDSNGDKRVSLEEFENFSAIFCQCN